MTSLEDPAPLTFREDVARFRAATQGDGERRISGPRHELAVD